MSGARGKRTKNAGQPLGFEATLWAAADKLRGNLEPSEYKHVVLGLVFLKYIADAFVERRARLSDQFGDPFLRAVRSVGIAL